MGLFNKNKESYLDKKSIIIYFSRADENYFGGALKYIDKGKYAIHMKFRDIFEIS